MIESVDRLSIAQDLSKWAEKASKTLPVLLEVNIAGEATKFGFRPEQLFSALGEINSLPKIEIHGLMTIAPWTADPERVRPVFRQLRDLKRRCEQVRGDDRLFALTTALRASREVGSFGVLTHPLDEPVRAFYRRWGFEDVPFDPNRSMIVRMVELERNGFAV